MKAIPLFGQFNEAKVLIEDALDGRPKRYYLEGITLQGNIKNQNNRIYPTQLLTEAIDAHCNKNLDAGRCIGELCHPTTNLHKINYDNVSHKFVNVRQEGNDFITKALVLQEGKGKILQNLCENEIQVGISSRGFGPTKKVDGNDVVQALHLISLGDIEHNPSAPDALMTAIMENREWIFENGEIVEIDLSEKIEDYQVAIKKASPKLIKEVMTNVFKDYFKTIK